MPQVHNAATVPRNIEAMPLTSRPEHGDRVRVRGRHPEAWEYTGTVDTVLSMQFTVIPDDSPELEAEFVFFDDDYEVLT